MKKEKETRRKENNNVNVMAANTLIRVDYSNKLKLNAVKTLATVTERGEPIKVNDVFLKIFDDKQENTLCIPVAFTITKNMFKMPTQKLRKSLTFVLEAYLYLKGIKLADVPPSQLTVLVGSNGPDTFMQLELRRGMQYQQCAIKTPLVTQW